MMIAVARTKKARNPSRTLDRVVGVDTEAPAKSCDMKRPYRTDQAICSTRAGSNGSDNEPITKAFHVVAIAAKHTEVPGTPAIAAAPGATSNWRDKKAPLCPLQSGRCLQDIDAWRRCVSETRRSHTFACVSLCAPCASQ